MHKKDFDAALDSALNEAYLLGFMSASEGWNGEYPFRDNNMKPEDNGDWILERDMDLNHLRYHCKES